jgi:hypothetical protein
MCIETQNLATALLPKFAQDVGYDVQLLQLISAYQKKPGTETYQAVQEFLLKKRNELQIVMNSFIPIETIRRINLNILDYEDNLLWSTARLNEQDKIVLLYQASEYSPQSTQGSSYKKFEEGSEYSLSWVSGGPIFAKGGALKFGIVTIFGVESCELEENCVNGYGCDEDSICASGICCNNLCASSC